MTFTRASHLTAGLPRLLSAARPPAAAHLSACADHPALGLILDSFHTLCLGDDLSGLAEAVPAEKLFFVQLADAPRLSMDPLSWSRHHRSFPGQGELPVAEFLRGTLAAGYRGPLSLEIFNDEFRSAPARRIATEITRRGGVPLLLGAAWFIAQARRQRALWETAS